MRVNPLTHDRCGSNSKWVILLQFYWLTHWGWDIITAISQTTFSNAFSWMNMYTYDLTEVCSWGLNQQYSSIGSDNGSAPTQRQANFWTNDNLLMHICVTRPQWVNILSFFLINVDHQGWSYNTNFFHSIIFPVFFRIINISITCWISHSYLTGATTAQLWWQLTNMNVIKKIWELRLKVWKFL